MALDEDGNGDIEVSELDSLLRSQKRKLRMTDKEITKLVKSTDQNGDGTVDIDEFLKMIEAENVKDRSQKCDIIHKAIIHRSGVRKAFEKYDKDGSGLISRDEFKLILEHKYQSSITTEKVNELMEQADKDKSGTIDYAEFLKAFTYFPIR